MEHVPGEPSPKEQRGRFFEDIEVGDVYRSRLGRTIERTDNTWFTLLTNNTNQVHFNDAFAAATEFGQPLVNSCLTLSIVVGLSVADTSENAVANLGWESITMPRPVFAGDTLWAESEVLAKRKSSSRPTQGIVTIRTRGLNQHGETVVEFVRTFLIYCRTAPEAASQFPAPVMDWAVHA
jgi:itaconyl-CoA hydratase